MQRPCPESFGSLSTHEMVSGCRGGGAGGAKSSSGSKGTGHRATPQQKQDLSPVTLPSLSPHHPSTPPHPHRQPSSPASTNHPPHQIGLFGSNPLSVQIPAFGRALAVYAYTWQRSVGMMPFPISAACAIQPCLFTLVGPMTEEEEEEEGLVEAGSIHGQCGVSWFDLMHGHWTGLNRRCDTAVLCTTGWFIVFRFREETDPGARGHAIMGLLPDCFLHAALSFQFLFSCTV